MGRYSKACDGAVSSGRVDAQSDSAAWGHGGSGASGRVASGAHVDRLGHAHVQFLSGEESGRVSSGDAVHGSLSASSVGLDGEVHGCVGVASGSCGAVDVKATSSGGSSSG